MAYGTGRTPADDAELNEVELEWVKLLEEDLVKREILDMMAVADGEDNSQWGVKSGGGSDDVMTDLRNEIKLFGQEGSWSYALSRFKKPVLAFVNIQNQNQNSKFL